LGGVKVGNRDEPMKVQTKITLLLALVVATFLIGLFAFRTYDRFKFGRIAQERLDERKQKFEDFLIRDGQQLETFVFDFGSDDQLLRAIASNDSQWFNKNLNPDSLKSVHANTVWVYRPDKTLLYPRNNLYVSDVSLPVPAEAFEQIFAASQLAHFFVNLPQQGLMEIRGATVHASRDFNRTTAQQGFFFAGRLWNQPMLEEMSKNTDNRIRIAAPLDRPRQLGADERNGTVAFPRTLKGWDDKPVAQLVIYNESPIVQELNRESGILLVSLITFALILLLLLSSLLVRWVRQPLRVIMESLTRNDPQPIERMCHDNSEFGELARTVRTFFSQRDNLIRVRHSQKMEAVGRLAGGVAHDFNNLLTAIIGYAELIANRSVHGDPLIRQNATLIGKAGEQAATLTRQLLAFSRKQLLQPKVLDLNSLVFDMEKLLRRVIGEHFDVRTKPEAMDGRVKADPSQLEQVILNLGVNARDAMPNGGALTITTSNKHLDGTLAGQISRSLRPGDYVVLSVSDTGVGMDDETKSRIFEPFFTTKGPGKGTGLGLATVYGIVRQSGGGISVESEPGRGTTFRIYFPYERAPIDHVKPPLPRVSVASNSETMLVVEDDDAVRQLICDVLEANGYTVLCAADGPEAIRVANKNEGNIDLLVTDVIMPHMNGPELAGALSATRPEMKVLYVSGYSANDISDHGVLKEDVQLLQKPFSPHTLLQRIREVLGNGDRWSANGRARVDTSQLQFSI
jgi:signal transduction histidine kinase/ActR/RegA family two-component response regulator